MPVVDSHDGLNDLSSMNDRQLLSAYLQGDEEAFGSLVTKYFGMVYAVAARHVGDYHLAEEVAQSVFIVFSRKARNLSSRVSVCGWLLQATRYVSRDAIKMRRRRRRGEQEFEAALESHPQTRPVPNAMESLLDEALLALPAADQAAVISHFIEGKNFKEIGEMLAITQDAAQKRVSRSVIRLRRDLVKRGVKITLASVPGLLMAQLAHEVKAQTLQSAIHAAQSAVRGKIAAGKALALADHAARLWPWRSAIGFGLKLALPALLITGGVLASKELSRPPSAFRVSDPRIETLGIAWARMDIRVATARQNYFATAPTDPRYQAVLREVNAISAESARLAGELDPLVTSPQNRTRAAEFLTVELGETLNLDPPEKLAVFSYIRKRLEQGTTFVNALKAMTQSRQTEADEIKAMLSAKQQQLFDQTYGADGLGLFSYALIANFGK